MIDPLKVIGPNGGNLFDDRLNAERRRADFNGGETTLHRFERNDVASRGLKNEQAWHRMAAYMLLAGRTNSEIALAANCSIVEVSQLRSQQWFQQLLGTIAANEGEAVIGAVMSEALASVETLVELRDDLNQRGATRLGAALALIEHAVGRPVQKTLTAKVHNPYRTPQEEYAELKQELEGLKNAGRL